MRAATIRECCVNKCPSLTSSDAFKASLAIATTARLFASLENRARGAFDVIAVHFCCDSNISPINIGKFFFASRSLKTLFLVSELFCFFNPLRTVDRFRFVILFILIYNIYARSIKIVNFYFLFVFVTNYRFWQILFLISWSEHRSIREIRLVGRRTGTLCAKSSLAKGEKSTDSTGGIQWQRPRSMHVVAYGGALSGFSLSSFAPVPVPLLFSHSSLTFFFSHSSLTFCVSLALFVILFWSTTSANELNFSSRYMYTGCIHNLANRKEINQCHGFGGEIL